MRRKTVENMFYAWYIVRENRMNNSLLKVGQMKKSENVVYIDRATGQECTESVMGDGALRFAYETALGRSLWGILFGSGFLSRLMGLYYDSSLSRKKISSLTSIPGCEAAEAEKDAAEYSSFNDFFIRKLKPGARPADMAENIFSSPGDGRLLIYPDISPDHPITVKGAVRPLNDLCGKMLPAKSYDVAVLRLAPVDYHRYHFPCDCVQTGVSCKIAGKYHSVNPIAIRKRPDLFVENTRVITELRSEKFGTFYYIEVGAFGVGSIVQTAVGEQHRKLDEKGYFKFGGSTIILVLEHGKIAFSPDLLEASAAGKEVRLKMGETIGSVFAESCQ